jgi:outer membrane protein assembly factor BamB
MTSRNAILCGVAALAGAAGLFVALSNSPPTTAAADPPPAAPPAPAQGSLPDTAPVAAGGGPSDHSMFGGTPSRNMVNLKDKFAKFPDKGPAWDEAEEAKKWEAQWVLWKADLGSRAYGGPTIAGGRVYCGTNNEKPRNPRDTQKGAGGVVNVDKGVLMCFDEKTGKFLWQFVHDKLPNGNVTDWPKEGLCSSPTVEGDRVYYVSNRCTVECADVAGMANGNQGAQTEKYKDATDGDLIWGYDLIKNQDVFPHNMSAGCPLIVGDILYTVTANGVDENHINLPSPAAPSFIALDKKTGKLLWKSSAPGKNIMHGQWSNPVYGEINGVRQVIFPGGDGWLHSFVPETGEPLWTFDCNPKYTVYELGGTGNRSDFIGTPVVHDNKVYIGVGQDPEHSTGIANFFCIAPKKDSKGDISKVLPGEKDKDGNVTEKPNPNSCELWRYGWEDKRKYAPRDFRFGRTMSTACCVDDVVYISELAGYLHCLNAKTGEMYWQYDTKASIWGSPMFVDGKIILATEAGDLWVFKHDKNPKKIDAIDAAKDAPDMKAARKIQKEKRQEIEKEYLLAKVEFPAPIRSTPIVANGVLFVMTENTLFALKTK